MRYLKHTQRGIYNTHSAVFKTHTARYLQYTQHGIYNTHSAVFKTHTAWYLQYTQHGIYNTHSAVLKTHTARYLQHTQHGIYNTHSTVFTIHTPQYLQYTQHGIYNTHSMVFTIHTVRYLLNCTQTIFPIFHCIKKPSGLFASIYRIFHSHRAGVYILYQWWTNPGCKVTKVTKFCIMARNIHGSSIWNLLCVTLLAPTILQWFLDFWKICAPCSIHPMHVTSGVSELPSAQI